MGQRFDLAPGTLTALVGPRRLSLDLRVFHDQQYTLFHNGVANGEVRRGEGVVIISQAPELSHDPRVPCFVLTAEAMGWLEIFTEEEHDTARTRCITVSQET